MGEASGEKGQFGPYRRESRMSSILPDGRLLEVPSCPSCGIHDRILGPEATREETQPDGTTRRRCLYSPHSLWATAATLLLDRGHDICKVQELLGHRHVTTTQIYDKRHRLAHEGASHDIPL